MLVVKIIGIGFIILILLGIVAWCQERLKAQHDNERIRSAHAQYEVDDRDWRKVGVVESYRNRKMMEVAYGDTCPICGERQHRSIGDGNGPHYAPCPTCEERYTKDRDNGIFPPGISSDNQCYNAIYYYALRLIEYELRTGAIDLTEAQAMQRSLIQEINEYDAKFKQDSQRQEYARSHPDTSYRNDYLN